MSSDHEFVKARNQGRLRGYLAKEEGPIRGTSPITIEEAMRTRLMIASAATAVLLAGAAFAQSDTAVNPPSSNPLPPGVATGNAATNLSRPSGQAGTGDSTASGPNAPVQGPNGATAPGVNGPSSEAATVAPAAGAPTERTPSASAGTQVITNGPIPDTRENRSKYGQPLSNAGRLSKPTGN